MPLLWKEVVKAMKNTEVTLTDVAKGYVRVVSKYVDTLENYEKLLARLINDSRIPLELRGEIGSTLLNGMNEQNVTIVEMFS